jgi:hypothetical protein
LNFCIRFSKISMWYDVISILMWFVILSYVCSFSCPCYCHLDIACNCYLGQQLVQLFISGLTCSHSTIQYLFLLNHYSFVCTMILCWYLALSCNHPVKLNLLGKYMLAKYLYMISWPFFLSKLTLCSVDCRNIIFRSALGFYY